MDREQIKNWAREAGATRMREPGTWFVLQDELEHFARLVRAAALEEAKKAVQYLGPDDWTAENCAAAIDALAADEKEAAK